MPLYHVNVPQYDDVLNNKYLKFYMLEVTEFSNDFESVRHRQNQTDLKIINNHLKIWCWLNVKFNEFRIYMTIVQFINHSSIPTMHNLLHQVHCK